MGYRKATYEAINSIEYSYHFTGKYGCKGEKRAPRRKRTPEEMSRQNQTNKTNYVRRLIKLNFFPNDYWITLMYPKGTRKPVEDVKSDVSRFVRQLRAEYKKRGEQLKFIYRIEIGRLGGIHIHFIINRLWGTDLLVSKCWPHRANFQILYAEGDFRQLASYITKPLPEDTGQMSFLEDTEKKRLKAYVPSRNLEKPEPVITETKRRTVKKLILEGPKPTPGYYIDPSSIEQGVNPYTGYSYFRYSEIRINPIVRQLKPPPDWLEKGKT